MTVHRAWLALFVLWLAFLSGGASSFIGSPGVVQGIRLTRLLEARKAALVKLEDQVIRTQREGDQLEKSRYAQEREIRRSLGYAAPDELIFEFTSPLSNL